MRLINVRTLQLETFLDASKRPPYAILSHTWLSDKEEVSFEDLQSYHASSSRVPPVTQEQPAVHPQLSPINTRPGFHKIREFCRVALQSEFLEWAWVDTCCIDKRSSAELSEAINSMFKWYKEATVCVVFLQDVETPEISLSNLEHSRYFTRGWTLQELLAPRQLSFYDSQWRCIGDMKQNIGLCNMISEITKVPMAFLTGSSLSEACVAKKMSWASKRKTTRVEDTAYCLMGIFDINMALLYGEGDKAFIRLQEEIIRQTHDHSILAWGELSDESIPNEPNQRFGALAASPKDFEDCWDFERAPGYLHYDENLDFQTTTAGIRLSASLTNKKAYIQGTFLKFPVCQLSCFSWRSPDNCLAIRIGEGPLTAPNNELTMVNLSLFQRTQVLPQYVRCSRELLKTAPIRRRGQTVTLAKAVAPEMTSNSIGFEQDDTGVIIVELPQGCSVEAIPADNEGQKFKLQEDQHRLGHRCFRVTYPPDDDIVCPIRWRYIWSGKWIALYVCVIWLGFAVAVITTIKRNRPFTIGFTVSVTLIYTFVVGFCREISLILWLLSRFLRIFCKRLGQLLQGRCSWYTTIDREDVRVGLRLIDPETRDGYGVSLFLCCRPRWCCIRMETTVNEEIHVPERQRIVTLRRARVYCYLSTSSTAVDSQSSPLQVHARWPKVVRAPARELALTRHSSKSPSLLVRFTETPGGHMIKPPVLQFRDVVRAGTMRILGWAVRSYITPIRDLGRLKVASAIRRIFGSGSGE
ncbi:hypothetical protein F5Y16DRAFT_382411 [Xylariaceae sp. FL0255]|nr:hypothetical protein F5Y16DRAFT_382411 [Xylariaceae sp. FL0255]